VQIFQKCRITFEPLTGGGIYRDMRNKVMQDMRYGICASRQASVLFREVQKRWKTAGDYREGQETSTKKGGKCNEIATEEVRNTGLFSMHFDRGNGFYTLPLKM